ncbi:MAG: sugar phosphate isomerase/epimerase, partial [Planctomycetales bacterium]
PLLKIGARLSSFGLPFRKALETAAKLGADAVEIDARSEVRPGELSQTGLRQIRKLMADLQLKTAAVRFQTRRGYDVLDDLDARIDATKAAMDMAFQLGAPVVINQIGRVPEDENCPEWNQLVQVLGDLGRHGDRTGAWLAASTGTESGEDLRRLINAAPEGCLMVNFDPGALIVNGFSPREDLQSVGPFVRHVYAKDAVRDLARGRGIETPLGRGTADFPELLALLEEQGYRGCLTVAADHPEDPLNETAQAIRYLRNLWE